MHWRAIFLLLVAVFSIATAEKPKKKNNEKQAGDHLPASPAPQIKQSTTKSVGQFEVNLVDSKQCHYDVLRFCPPEKQANNFAVLECFQKDSNTYALLQPVCQRYVWMYKRNLTIDDRFENAARGICGNEILNKTGCLSSIGKKGHLITCLIENYDTVSTESCRYFLTKMAVIVFTDYRLIENFYEDCDEDIRKLNCANLRHVDLSVLFTNESAVVDQDKNNKDDPDLLVDFPIHQGETIRCLQLKVGAESKELSPHCERAIFRVSEFQANDFALDRPLFYACRNDRDRFCADVVAGEGRVYACLMLQQTEHGFSEPCRTELRRREALVEKDVRIDKPFYTACKSALRAYKCSAGKQSDGVPIVDVAHALVCLNDALNEEDPLGEITPACRAELSTLHKLVFVNKPLSPKMVSACGEEIAANCNDERYSTNVAELFHCLMEHAVTASRNQNQREQAIEKAGNDNENMPHPGLSQRCFAELRTLMREADVAEDIRVDPVLAAACEPVIKTACTGSEEEEDEMQPKKRRQDSASLFVCLMEHIAEPVMTAACAKRLMEIEYFVTRDYHLDKALLTACRKDAREKCHAGDQAWFTEHRDQIDRGDLVEAREEETNELQPEEDTVERGRGDVADFENGVEEQEISRRKRAPARNQAVDQGNRQPLQPQSDENDVQEDIDEELIELEHEDFVLPCLFNLMRRNSLEDTCAVEVRRTMRERSTFVGLMPDVERVCFFDLTKLCSETDHMQPGAEMNCLQDHFDDLHPRCRMMVANYTRDVRIDASIDFYTYRACASVMRTFCQPTLGVRSAWQHALDVHVRGGTPDRDQETTLMDCLIDHKNEPSVQPSCRLAISHHQRVAELESFEVTVDLYRSCKEDARDLCPGFEKGRKQDLLACLSEVWTIDYLRQYGVFYNETVENAQYDAGKTQLNDRTSRISSGCRKQLLREFSQQEEDVELDDVVLNNCANDIRDHCEDLDPRKDARGEIVECLKENFESLEQTCRFVLFKHELRDMGDQRIDYGLQRACGGMIEKHCGDEGPSEILECLQQKKREPGFDRSCYQVLTAREVVQAQDIRLNPQLSKSCRGDVQRLCSDVVREHMEKQRALADDMDDKAAHQAMRGRDEKEIAKMRSNKFRALTMEFHGEVIHCLREHYVKGVMKVKLDPKKMLKQNAEDQLSEQCSEHLRFVMRESALNVHLDAVLKDSCAAEIRDNCADELENPSFLAKRQHKARQNDDDNVRPLHVNPAVETRIGVSRIEECLKRKFTTAPRRFGEKCQKEVIRLFQEARADVHVDPVLQQACALDLTFHCAGVRPGMGQQFACLLGLLESEANKLRPECSKKLKERVEMFNAAMERAPVDSFNDLAQQVIRSPHRAFFAGVMLSGLLAIFVMGLSCGCLSRRRAKIVQKSK